MEKVKKLIIKFFSTRKGKLTTNNNNLPTLSSSVPSSLSPSVTTSTHTQRKKICSMRLSLSLLFFSSIFFVSFCDTVTISSLGDFITFSNNVNGGSSYSGVTVLLTTDIDFTGYSEQFTPIGNSINDNNNFRGIFDGQGHVIGNLTVSTSSSLYAGLFGYSAGATIRDVVIDDTCSFANSFVSSFEEEPCVGSIIGYCASIKEPCTIENIVNMASVSYGGDVTGNAYIGGIVGALILNTYPDSIIKNCVNYGTVTDSGKCISSGSKWAEIGGIVGGSQGVKASLLYSYIQNCANYGTIIHNGTTSNLAIGGIAGFGYYSSIQNCVSSGVISSNRGSDCIGTIVGAISEYAEITHCYWTSDVGDFNVYDPDESITVSATSISLVSLNQTTVDKLNEYAAKQGDTWSKWFIVHLNGGRINNITQESLVEIQKHIPDPVKEGNTFLSWCKDAECNEVLDPKKDSVSEITDIYAKWDTSTTTNYIVTFDFDNGTTVNETFSYGSRIVYPVISEREGYTFNGWDSMPDNMPAKNITITALWTPNNYTVTFDFDNGTTVNKTFSYNSYIEYPKNLIKEGYTFNEWSNYHESMPANNITITAQWTPNNYTVTFDFGNGTTANETFSYGSSIVYPNDVVKEGYTLSWNNYHEFMPAKNITITAQWTPNNYTVKLDLGDGTILTSMKVAFSSPYGTLPTPAKDGYTFVGWVTDNNDTVTSETIVTIPNNHTLHARWKEIPTQYVEIVFGTKDLTEEEINDLVKKYANASDFTIIKVEGDDGDGTRVIIKFNDAEKAENFVEVIKESGGTKNIGFISEGDIMSFTITYYPMALFSIFI